MTTGTDTMIDREEKEFWQIEATNWGSDNALAALNGRMRNIADNMLFWQHDKWDVSILDLSYNFRDKFDSGKRTDTFSTANKDEAHKVFMALRRMSDKVEMIESYVSYNDDGSQADDFSTAMRPEAKYISKNCKEFLPKQEEMRQQQAGVPFTGSKASRAKYKCWRGSHRVGSRTADEFSPGQNWS